MPNPRTAAEWAEKCNQDYLTSMRVEGRSNGHLRHGLCLTCADAHAHQQVREALEEVEKAVNRANEAKHLGHYRSACCVAVDEITAAIARLREGTGCLSKFSA